MKLSSTLLSSSSEAVAPAVASSSSSSSSLNQYYMQDQEIKRLQNSIAVVTIILSCFAIFLTIIFFIFNIRYRNFRLIKMSSPNINNIINFNCILLYMCPILNSVKGLYITNELLANFMCQINAWILPLSSTAIYAAMLTKAWRIYKIFETTPKAKKIVIKDIRLVVYILCLMAFDAFVVLVWQLVDTVKLKPRYLYEIQTQPMQVILPSSYLSKMSTTTDLPPTTTTNTNLFSPFSGQNDTLSSGEFDLIYYITTTPAFGSIADASAPIVQNYTRKNQLKLVFECNSNYNEVWITILTMYKIILLMYGIYLAWIIRNINVPSMNDSKYLLLSTYTIIVCGLGSMTLMQLLSNWPDVVQAFFSIGIILSTCTTQCLLFIPKIRLWYKRKNDDNFKISLSQIFLHASSNCYYADKQNRNSGHPTSSTNMLNLEDELCELLHENSQLKNFLKEKEEIIKLLQDKIRMAKARLFQVNSCSVATTSDVQKKCLLSASNTNSTRNDSAPTTVNNNELIYEFCHLKTNTSVNQNENNPNNNDPTSFFNNNNNGNNCAISTVNLNQQQAMPMNAPQSSRPHSGAPNMDSGFDVDSSTCTATTTTETVRTSENNTNTAINKSQTIYSSSRQIYSKNTEELKNDLDEVEELTSRVRDSISVDLSNTRRYSPLLYEYYRKQLELAKSIQCTYNIQCNSLFDAMTLMRKCLKDYCQTVHNPEYLAIDAIKSNHHGHEYSYNDFLSQNNLHHAPTRSNHLHHHHHYGHVNAQSQQSASLPLNQNYSFPPIKEHKNLNLFESSPKMPTMSTATTTTCSTTTPTTTTTAGSNSTGSTASGSVSFASTCSISSLNNNKNLFSNINYDSNLEALNFNNYNNQNNDSSNNNNSSNSSNLSQTQSTTTATTTTTNNPKSSSSIVDNKQTYV